MHYQYSTMKRWWATHLQVFADLVFTCERIEVGQKIGKFDHPAFPPAQQCHYSANISSSHYSPPSHPQRPSLNQPQSLPAAHPIPNATLNMNQNTNQGRNFPENKPAEFTPIPMPYVD